MRKIKIASAALGLVVAVALLSCWVVDSGRRDHAGPTALTRIAKVLDASAAYAADASKGSKHIVNLFAGFPTEANSPNAIWPIAPSFLKVLPSIPGGTIMPAMSLQDPYPEFNGIALDPKNGIAVLSDTNLKSVLVYPLDVKAPPTDPDPTAYKSWVKGPNTFLSFAAGIAVDPVRHEFYTTENDVGDDVAAFPYSANGDFKSRVLAVPHGSYGISISQHYKQMAVAIQHNAEIIFYPLQAKGADRPLRSIRGLSTKLADPHGVVWDDQHHEIFVSNYGNWNRGYWDPDYTGGGHYYPPSVLVFRDDAKGNVKPLRIIQGPNTQFNWPTGIAVDNVHNELFVANEAASQILVFSRTANGNVAPIRILGGPHTNISQPMGVAYDPIRDQIWVANFGHEAEIFDRTAQGDVAPQRIVRNAPEGSAAAGFGNPMAITYDSKRDVLVVPNCVSDPRIAIFARTASGNIRPERIIEGQRTKLTRVAHGITYDPVHDLIIATEPLAASIVFFPGDAQGNVPPLRVIQGPHTLIHSDYQPSVDDEHNELWIADITSKALMAFPLMGNGDIAPLRVIQGPKTQIAGVLGAAVDPKRNLVIACGYTLHYQPAIFIFNRTDNGNVAPLRIITGPTTGIVGVWHVAVADGKIFLAAANFKYIPPYDASGSEPRLGCTGPPLPFAGPLGFIGVWNETDNGDVAPRAIIRGPETDLLHPVGIVVDPSHGEVFATDSVRNGAFGYLVPNFF